jgi:hypothetical protein
VLIIIAVVTVFPVQNAIPEQRLKIRDKRRIKSMTKDVLQGKWKQLRGAVKQRWVVLTDTANTAGSS